jgi:hypothetical protein
MAAAKQSNLKRKGVGHLGRPPVPRKNKGEQPDRDKGLVAFLVVFLILILVILVVFILRCFEEIAGTVAGDLEFIFLKIGMQARSNALVADVFAGIGFEVDAVLAFSNFAVIFLFVLVIRLPVQRHRGASSGSWGSRMVMKRNGFFHGPGNYS